jgi:hypothetical protein
VGFEVDGATFVKLDLMAFTSIDLPLSMATISNCCWLYRSYDSIYIFFISMFIFACLSYDSILSLASSSFI